MLIMSAALHAGFNSRAREGRDMKWRSLLLLIRVSTHAPARGATVNGFARDVKQKFQLTRPRGARRKQ